MQSQQTCVLLHVLGGIFQDAILAFPGLKGSLSKDLERITLYCQSRGLGVFTLDLPNLDALLLRGLESGRLCPEGPFSKRVSFKNLVPKLFSGLWLRIFDKNLCLKQDVDVNAVMFLRQLCRLGAKLLVECSHDRIISAVENYHDIEERIRPSSTNWTSDDFDSAQAAGCNLVDCSCNTCCTQRLHHEQGELFSSLCKRGVDHCLRDRDILEHCQLVADIVISKLGHYDPLFHSWSMDQQGLGIGFKHGPGAVASREKQWRKSLFPSWSTKLEGRFRFGVSAICVNDDRLEPINHELPSRLICVPKSAKAPRLIASEPVEHQWCQQNLWSWLDRRSKDVFKGHFIDFRNQKASSDLVLRSSLDKSLVTVDLSDASDRLSCWTVERVFRSNASVLTALHAARTRWLRNDISSPGSFIKLKKFASQGTATTFPVQSLVFLCIALSSALGDTEPTWENIWKLRDKVRVYGDDIIAPRHGYVRLIRLMDLLGLKVNVAKSYADGYFRESCGVHGFMGYDVTPVMPKTVVAGGPASVVAVVDTINNLFYKGYWNASQRLRSTIPVRLSSGLRIVGPAAAGHFGVASYTGSYEGHLKRRWHPSLHRFEVQSLCIREGGANQHRGGYSTLLDFYARPYHPGNPRVVSAYGSTRREKLALRWEPAIT